MSFATKTRILTAIVVVLTTIICAEAKSTKRMECYQCITRNPSWKKESCKSNKVTCTLGSFCMKYSFGNSLILRTCAPGGTPTYNIKSENICKKVKSYMTSAHVSSSLKKIFGARKSVFESSCPTRATLFKQPKKAECCTKSLCNSAEGKSAGIFRNGVIVAVGVVVAKFL